MRLFLDTEFNGFGGKLISMALVPEDDSKPAFYKEIEMTDQLDPWVRQNVVPYLIQAPCSYCEFQQHLTDYLWTIGECTIIADWPDDIRYLCESLITGPGECISPIYNMKFEIDFSVDYQSLVPHNALEDAKAIKEFYSKREAK